MPNLTLRGKRLPPGQSVYVLGKGQAYAAYVRSYDAAYARRVAQLRGKGETPRRVRTQHELDRIVALVAEEKREPHQLSRGGRGYHVTAENPAFILVRKGERYPSTGRPVMYGGSDFPTLEKARARARRYSAALRRKLEIHDTSTGKLYPVEGTNPPRSRKGQRRRTTRKAGRAIAGGGRSRTRDNPPLVVVNPPRGARVAGVLGVPLEIKYKHAQDGKYYRHTFKRGDVIELMADGSFRVRNRDGKTLWGDF